MPGIESFEFFLVLSGPKLCLIARMGATGAERHEGGVVTATVFAADAAARPGDPLDAELASYNHAFSELELPWRWDAHTLRQLLSIAGGSDVVGTYVERSQAHLLRAYDKGFLSELVHATRARYRDEGCAAHR